MRTMNKAVLATIPSEMLDKYIKDHHLVVNGTVMDLDDLKAERQRRDRK